MPALNIAPAAPSFGGQLAQALGQAGTSIGQGIQQRYARTALQKLLNPQDESTNIQQSPSEGGTMPVSSQGLTPAKAAQLYDLAVTGYGKDTADQMMKAYVEQQKMSQKERHFMLGQEMEREKTSEKPLGEMSENLRNLEAEDIRFERLGQLFSPENEKKFPSPLLTAAFTKDGEIRPSALSQLSTQAQESIKLVQDELSGAKDTYGARVTNFDVQNYLKRLPSLLNTAEGRRTVLRDLQLLNKFNRLHDEKILEIVDEYGGGGKIPLSKAEAIFRKKYGNQIKDLKEEFVNPEKKVFHDMPDANLYHGRELIDDETGKKFKSDGKQWIPQ